MKRLCLSLIWVALAASPAMAGGRYYEVKYAPSDKEGELKLGVTYTLWVPDGVAKLRGVIVHQHGCGSGACKGGETAAYDLHWQALAKKWDCALLGPSYQQDDKQNCRLWSDPRNGSAKTFVNALGEFAKQSKHSELAEVPWCLWGHSGGGMWVSLMLALHPERVVAVWCRSGTALAGVKKELPEAVYRVPVMLNPGAKEKGDKRFGGLWTASVEMAKEFRARGAPVGFAADPNTGHECGDSRYLAIPFFDACLSLRLPKEGIKLRPIELNDAWYADLSGDKAVARREYKGKVEVATWLPNEAVAKAWMEYVKTGHTSDTTPPPAPTGVKARATAEGIELTWDAAADFESGLKGFVLLRDGKELVSLPEKPRKQAGRALFQGRSYHDTPERPLPAMRYVDRSAKGEAKHEYAVIAVNGAGLKSKAAR